MNLKESDITEYEEREFRIKKERIIHEVTTFMLGWSLGVMTIFFILRSKGII